MTTGRPRLPDNERPRPVGVRLTPVVLDQLDALKPVFFPQEGANASRSAVMRRAIMDGLVLLDPGVLRRLDAVRGKAPRADAITRAVLAGLDALERGHVR